MIKEKLMNLISENKQWIKQKTSVLLICSMMASQLTVSTPMYAFAETDWDAEETELIHINGQIINMDKGHDISNDVDLRLFANGKLTDYKPELVKVSEDNEITSDAFGSVRLINDLVDDREDGQTDDQEADLEFEEAELSDTKLSYEVWEWMFDNLPYADENGEEFEYTVRDLKYDPSGEVKLADIASDSDAKASSANASNTEEDEASDSNSKKKSSNLIKYAKEMPSYLASDSDATKNKDALYWVSLDRTEVYGEGNLDCPAEEGVRLVYVPYTDIKGSLQFAEDADYNIDDIEFTAEIAAHDQENDGEEFMDPDLEVEINAEKLTWKLRDVLAFNPLTCEQIDYCVTASTELDIEINYQNTGIYADYDEEGAYQGATIVFGALEPEAVPVQAYGVLHFEDADDVWGIRPELEELEDTVYVYEETASGEEKITPVSVQFEDNQGEIRYTVDGMETGKTYRLMAGTYGYQTLCGNEDITEEGIVLTPVSEDLENGYVLPEITEKLKTRTLTGFINWRYHAPVAGIPEITDFLTLNYGSKNVSDRISMEMTETEKTAAGSKMAITLTGVPSVLGFELVAKSMGGFTITPEVTKIYPENRLPVHSRLTKARMLMSNSVIMLTADAGEAPKQYTFTIKNIAYGNTAEAKKYEYQYTIDGVASDPVALGANEELEITATVSNATITIKQVKPEDSSVHVFEGKEQHVDLTLASASVATFSNISTIYKQARKDWNDNADTSKRPSKEDFLKNIELLYKRADMSNYVKIGNDPDWEHKIGLDQAEPEVTTDENQQSGVNQWVIQCYGLPEFDENGNPIEYTFEEKTVANYILTATSSDATYAAIFTNTLISEFNAKINWQDMSNKHNTRLANAADMQAELLNHITLYRKTEKGIEEELELCTEADAKIDAYVVSVKEDGNKWNFNVAGIPSYDNDGKPYEYYVKVSDTEKKWNISDSTLDNNDDVTYEKTIVNTGTNATKTDVCYDDGTINLTLTGKHDVKFNKIWACGGETDPKKLPRLSFDLFRYLNDGTVATNYQKGTVLGNVSEENGKVTQVFDCKSGDIITGSTIIIKDQERFDTDGNELVYFAKEDDLPGYEQIVENEDKIGTDGCIIENGTIKNRKTGTFDCSIEKTWVSKAYQDIQAEVTFTVTGTSKNPKGGSFTKEITLSGFSAETLTQQAEESLQKYDEDGYEYTYTVSEKSVSLKSRIDGKYYPMSPIYDETDTSKIIGFMTTDKHFANEQYRYIIKDKDGKTNNEREIGENKTSDLKFANTLEDKIKLEVEKVWAGDWSDIVRPGSLEFKVSLDSTDTHYKVTMNAPVTGWEKICWATLSNADGTVITLPRYDKDGLEYNYTVKEEYDNTATWKRGGVRYDYYSKSEWNGATLEKTRVAKVTNYPPGEGYHIGVMKIWKDGGDVSSRKPIIMEITQTEGASTETKETKYVVLSAQNNWYELRVPVKYDPNSTTVTTTVREYGECIGNLKVSLGDTTGSTTDVQTFDDPEAICKSIAKVSYDGKQYGDGVNESSKIKCNKEDEKGPGTLDTKKDKDDKDSYLYDVSHGTTEVEGQKVYTSTNTRRGFLNINVSKEWKDGGYKDKDGKLNKEKPNIAYFKLESKLVNETKTFKCNRENGEKSEINLWINLPKYDANGALINYTVTEVGIASASDETYVEFNGGTAQFYYKGNAHPYVSSGGMIGYTHGVSHSDDIISYSYTNARSDTIKNFTINKVWKDGNQGKRPDIYLVLYQFVGEVEDEKTGLKDVTGAAENYVYRKGKQDDDNNSWWTYTFNDLPKYTKDGEEIHYLVVEKFTSGNQVAGQKDEHYEAYYYGDAPDEKGNLDLSHPFTEGITINGEEGIIFALNGQTIVNVRTGDRAVKGQKLWNMEGAGKMIPAIKDLPKATLTLYRSLNGIKDANWNKVILLGGEESRNTVNGSEKVSISNYYDFSVTGLAKYEKYSGEPYKYWIEETGLNGYTVPSAPIEPDDNYNYTITNTYTPEPLTKVVVEKHWSIADTAKVPYGWDLNEYQYEYPEVVFDLTRKMQKPGADSKMEDLGYESDIKEQMKPTEASKWRATSSDLAYYAPNGYPFHYEVSENKLNGFRNPVIEWITATDSQARRYYIASVSNVYDPSVDTTTIGGIKTWADQDNRFELRPSSDKLELTLKRKEGAGFVENLTEKFADLHYEWIIDETKSKNTWEYKFYHGDKTAEGSYNFPQYAPNGKKYTYYVEETLKAPYDVIYKKTSDKLKLTNTLETVSVKVTKNWNDYGWGNYGVRPTKVSFGLWKKDGETGTYGKMPEKFKTTDLEKAVADSITAEYTGLPKYVIDGDKAVQCYYQIRETAMKFNVNGTEVTRVLKADQEQYTSGDSYRISTESNATGNTITNNLVTCGSITVTKKWIDANDQDGLRPTSITVQLYRSLNNSSSVAGDTAMGGSVVLNAKNNWTATWNNLPKYVPTASGEQTYFYKVKEIGSVSGYDTSYAVNAGSAVSDCAVVTIDNSDTEKTNRNVTITNTHRPLRNVEVKFTKNWGDYDNKWGIRPTTLKLQLWRKAGTGAAEKAGTQISLSNALGINAVPIVSSTDFNADGFYTYNIASNSNWTITNPTDASAWTITYTGLDYAKPGVGKYEYWIEEDPENELKGYTNDSKKKTAAVTVKPEKLSLVTNTLDSLSLTNTLEKISVTATKQWEDYGWADHVRPTALEFELYRKTDGEYESVKISSDYGVKTEKNGTYTSATTGTDTSIVTVPVDMKKDEFWLKYENLPKYDGQGNAYSYEIREKAMLHGTAPDQIRREITWKAETLAVGDNYIVSTTTPSNANSTNGDYEQTITNKLVTYGNITVEKIWNARDKWGGDLPDKIEVQLYRSLNANDSVEGDTKMGDPVALTKDNDWKTEWENLPRYQPIIPGSEPQPYYYKVKEVQISSYEPNYKVGNVETETCAVICFDPNEFGNTTINALIINTRIPGVISFKKTDAKTQELIKGATFALYKGDAEVGKFKTGSKYRYKPSESLAELEKIESLTDNSTELINLEWGNYYIEEIEPAPGYMLPPLMDNSETKKYYFKVDADTVNDLANNVIILRDTSNGDGPYIASASNAADFNKITNEKTGITFVKQNEAGDKLEGGSYQILDESKKQVIGFYTKADAKKTDAKETAFAASKVGVTLYGIPAGSYYFHEVTAPAGYELSADVAFTIKNDGSVEGVTDKTVIMTDKKIEVAIKKVSSEDATKVLTGAEFTVSCLVGGKFAATTSNAIEHLTMENFQTSLSGQLIAGQTYSLEETKAPVGYKLQTTPVKFKVDEKGEITIEPGAAIASVESKSNESEIPVIVFKDDEERISVTIEKKFDDELIQKAGIRPESIKVKLYEKIKGQGEETRKEVEGGEITLKKENEWKYTWSDLRTSRDVEVSTADGKTYTPQTVEYYVEEDDAVAKVLYTASQTYATKSDAGKISGTITLTNKEKLTPSGELKISKANPDGAKTDEFTVNVELMTEDEKIKLGLYNGAYEVYNSKDNTLVEKREEKTTDLKLKGGQYIVISVPKDLKCVVTEKTFNKNGIQAYIPKYTYPVSQLKGNSEYPGGTTETNDSRAEVTIVAEQTVKVDIENSLIMYTAIENLTINDSKKAVAGQTDMGGYVGILTNKEFALANPTGRTDTDRHQKILTNNEDALANQNNQNNQNNQTDIKNEDEVDYTPYRLAVVWKPYTYWRNEKTFTIRYLEYENADGGSEAVREGTRTLADISSISKTGVSLEKKELRMLGDGIGRTKVVEDGKGWKELTVSGYLETDGTLKLIERDKDRKIIGVYKALGEEYGEASISMEDGLITLKLAPGIAGMPFLSKVKIKFIPTIAVENTTVDDKGGQVAVESGTYSPISDGKQDPDGKDRYEQKLVYGNADSGYCVDLDNLTIGNVNDLTGSVEENTKAVKLKLDEHNRFSADITYTVEDTGTEYPFTVTGKVNILESNSRGNATKISIELDKVGFPCDIGIPFVRVKSSGGGSGGSGGGGTSTPTPGGPGVPKPEEAPKPAEPGEIPTVPGSITPDKTTMVHTEQPLTPGMDVIVRDKNGNIVYQGPLDANGNIPLELPEGIYDMTMLDEDGNPLAELRFTLGDLNTPLFAPRTGDDSMPYGLLAMIMLGSLAGGTGIIMKKKKESQEDEKQEK